MKSLHIRDVDEVVLDRLRTRAGMHHRSLQGEVRAILQEAAEMAPDPYAVRELDLVTVSVKDPGSWSREQIYGDDAR